MSRRIEPVEISKSLRESSVKCEDCHEPMLGVFCKSIREACLGCGGQSCIDNEARKEQSKLEYAEKRRQARLDKKRAKQA